MCGVVFTLHNGEPVSSIVARYVLSGKNLGKEDGAAGTLLMKCVLPDYFNNEEHDVPRKSAKEIHADNDLAPAVEPGFIQDPDGFINVPVSKTTREQLHALKASMRVSSQAEVIEKAIAIVAAIDAAVRK